MRKTIRILTAFLFILAIISIGQSVSANTIKSISMDIYIDDSGDATITEVWKCTTDQGTEVYHPYYNLGNSEITMLSVKEGSTQYTQLNKWNTSGTLQSKANKFGINKISNGVELCWGISNYGSHTYTVTYKITNFVSELTDSQMIYWTLIPYDFSNTIGQVYIKIHTDFNIKDTVDVWGYGNYGGTAYVYDGYIEMQSDGTLATSEYMTILVKFPANTFTNLNNNLNQNFNYYYEMAEEGATKYTENDGEDEIATIVGFTCYILLLIISAIIGIKNADKWDFGEAGKIKKGDIQYFRDIPCEGNLYKAYFIANKYGLISKKTDILGAIILKWTKEGKISIQKKEAKGIFKKEDMVVVLTSTNPEDISVDRERQLFKMLYEASQDGNLESKEFEKWCNTSYSKILGWFDAIISIEEQELIKEGLIDVKEKKSLGIFKTKKHVATYQLKEQAMQLAGLKKYLEDYTLIKDREAIEVSLFEDYLIYAQMLGIADKVEKQFKELYPDIIQESCFTSYDNIVFIHTCSTKGITSANKAKQRAEAYSSGGGGFSSGGGGGGSFGGGGGRRRFPLKCKK